MVQLLISTGAFSFHWLANPVRLQWLLPALSGIYFTSIELKEQRPTYVQGSNAKQS